MKLNHNHTTTLTLMQPSAFQAASDLHLFVTGERSLAWPILWNQAFIAANVANSDPTANANVLCKSRSLRIRKLLLELRHNAGPFFHPSI